MATDIKEQKLLYHLTDIDNLKSILVDGLMSRSALTNFTDVADPEIIESRKSLGLENLVPFHFYGGSPFDGRVQLDNQDKCFVLMTVWRADAKAKQWKIIPKHPLAGDDIELMEYDAGLAAIDWDKMNERDYLDADSKNACMAECLSEATVPSDLFHSFYVKTEEDQKRVAGIMDKLNYSRYVNVNEHMFVK